MLEVRHTDVEAEAARCCCEALVLSVEAEALVLVPPCLTLEV